MSIFHGNFFSDALLCTVDVHVFLPLPTSGDYNPGPPADFRPGIRYPALYLLHGAYGGGVEWMEKTRLAHLAQSRRLAVVTAPAGGSFYRDCGPAYERFFAEELPHMAETVFPLSTRREDRFVAGLSMGGYGALRLALRHPDRYAAAAALSGAFDLAQVLPRLAQAHPMGAAVFGHITDGGPDQWDLAKLTRRALDAGAALPALLLSCGVDDAVLDMNRALRDALRAMGVALTYEEHPGDHDWDYWDAQLPAVLDFLLAHRGA